MTQYLPNPFTEAYVTHTVSESHFVKYFSPILVVPAGAIFQSGNVVLRGTVGSGKSMLLRLLDPEIRIAYADPSNPTGCKEFPVPKNLRNFVSARVDLSKSGLLDIVNTLPLDPEPQDISRLAQSFGDFFNFWILRGLFRCIETVAANPTIFEYKITSDSLDAFAQAFGIEDCFFGSLEMVSDWYSLKEAIKQRIVQYRSWANGNSSLTDHTSSSKTAIGEPISRAADLLRECGAITRNTNVFVTIDQLEALWMQGGIREKVGTRLRREILEVFGKRDNRVSYRIGARRYDWGKGGDLAMRDGRNLEEGRDFLSVDIDQLLRRGENRREWAFKELAKDAFKRRIQTVLDDYDYSGSELQESDVFFGPSPRPQDVIEKAIRNPDPTGERLLRLDDNWPPNWKREIQRCYQRKIENLPNSPSESYPFDPLNALLLTAWGLQTGGRSANSKERRYREEPPTSASEAPWSKSKQYWRKERFQQAVLQLVSRHQQRLLWWGEAKVLQLCGGNILRFITICRETWDYWQRLSKEQLRTGSVSKPIVPSDIQSRAIAEASRKIYEMLRRQPGTPAGDLRIRFLDEIALWLRNSMLEDVSMSYPGNNGFSIRTSDLEEFPDLRQLIEEAVGWGDLDERRHTSKNKEEKARKARVKFYTNPALAPWYQLPETHTKEPVYATIDEILNIAVKAGVIDRKPLNNRKDLAATELQPDFFSDED